MISLSLHLLILVSVPSLILSLAINLATKHQQRELSGQFFFRALLEYSIPFLEYVYYLFCTNLNEIDMDILLNYPFETEKAPRYGSIVRKRDSA